MGNQKKKKKKLKASFRIASWVLVWMVGSFLSSFYGITPRSRSSCLRIGRKVGVSKYLGFYVKLVPTFPLSNIIYLLFVLFYEIRPHSLPVEMRPCDMICFIWLAFRVCSVIEPIKAVAILIIRLGDNTKSMICMKNGIYVNYYNSYVFGLWVNMYSFTPIGESVDSREEVGSWKQSLLYNIYMHSTARTPVTQEIIR